MKNSQVEASIVINPDGRVYEATIESIEKGNNEITPSTHKQIAKFNQYGFVHGKTGAMSASVSNADDIMLNREYSRAMKSAVNSNGRTLSASSTEVAQSENLAHLQLIRLFPTLQGDPDDYFFLDSAFVVRPIPKLQMRESFRDAIDAVQYLNRLERPKTIRGQYDEIDYNLEKLEGRAEAAIEDIYRTIINPFEVDISQIRWGFKRRRNLSARAAIESIGNTLGNTITLGTTSGNFHSTMNAANELNTICNDFLKENAVPITHMLMNPKTFAAYTSNTWTHNVFRTEPVRMPKGGVAPMPGLQNITAIVDVHLLENRIYAINKANCLRLGEGPKLLRRYYDNDIDATIAKYVDFHQYLCVHPQLTKIDRKYGGTITTA